MKSPARAKSIRADAPRTPTAEESSGVWPSRDQVSVSLRRPVGVALSTLVVQAPKHWDIAAELYRMLFDVRVQIVHGGIRRMSDGQRVEHRLELVEFDGAHMDRVRREEIELSVYDLLDAVALRHEAAEADAQLA